MQESFDNFGSFYYTPSVDYLPKNDWVAPSITDLPSLAGVKRLAIDIETRDPDIQKLGSGSRRSRQSNYIVGVGLAIEDGPEFYLPMRHEAGGNLDQAQVLRYLREELKTYPGTIVGANLPYDMDWLGVYGIEAPSAEWRDVQVADPLINELHDDYDLETLCKRYELPGKDEVHLRDAAAVFRVDPKVGLWRLRAKDVAAYCMADARRTLQILRRQEEIIARDSLTKIWDLERKVTPILVKMKARGVRVDTDLLDKIEQKSIEVEDECLRKVSHMSGIQVTSQDIWKAEVLARVLTSLGILVPKTELSKRDSVDKALLKVSGEVGAALMRAREWNMLRCTFVKQIRDRAIHHGDHWRIHADTNQLRATDDSGRGRGVRYGRTSMSQPNIQQQPVRHKEFGKMWRSVFCADYGARWACSDWSQQEPRIAVHYAELLGLPGAKEFADEYRRNPSLDIHAKLAEIAGMPRDTTKQFVNGRLYGMGDPKLCRAIGCEIIIKTIRQEAREVPGLEGQAKIDQFNRFAPWITGLTKAASDVAQSRGFVWDCMGRRCNFKKGQDGKYEYTYRAFNRIGQGSAASQMKATLIEADKEGIPVQLVVHDEFDFSFTDIEQARRLKQIQMHTVKFNVPMKVDLEIGPNWGDMVKDQYERDVS